MSKSNRKTSRSSFIMKIDHSTYYHRLREPPLNPSGTPKDPYHCNPQPSTGSHSKPLGISETERQKRKKSNSLSTKINFSAWIIEVENYYVCRLTGKLVSLIPILLSVFGSYVTWGGENVPALIKNGYNRWEIPDLSWNLVSYEDCF